VCAKERERERERDEISPYKRLRKLLEEEEEEEEEAAEEKGKNFYKITTISLKQLTILMN
jgi:hypothetical protein